MNILEFKMRGNQHQTHFEDLILLGKDGIEEMNDKIDKFISSFHTNIPNGLVATQKIDGAPAVVIWSKFEGYPDNSICLKSFLTSNKNCLSSYEDIEEKYGDRPDMASKLRYCLELARCIPEGEAWQGDCLYTKSTLKEVEIKGQEYLTFQPNKIIYAFTGFNPDFEKIKDSDFGICFHTVYTGDLENKSQSFDVDDSKLNNIPSNIYIMSPKFKDIKTQGKFDIDQILSTFEYLKSAEHDLLGDPAYQELTENPLFMSYWNMFENSNLSDKQATKFNVKEIYNDLVNYISDKLKTEYDKKVAQLKTEKGLQGAQSSYEKKLNELKELIEKNKDLITKIVICMNYAVDIKMLMWEGYKSVNPGYSTFYKSLSQGYIPADMEGVALSSGPDIVKLVDRSTFSHANRNPDILSGFEHN